MTQRLLNLVILLLPLLFLTPAVADHGDQSEALKPPSRAAPAAGMRTMGEALATFAPSVEPAWVERFAEIGLSYPPSNLTLIGLKDERRLEVWTRAGGRPHFIEAFDILDASGLSGPKRRRGDHQVPEGIYQVDAFNPNSRFHLSMRINYPNDFDRRMGLLDGRTDLGDNIFIHGSDYSEGCLAIGDPAIERLFVLAARVPHGGVEVIIAAHDARRQRLEPRLGLPDWVDDLYAKLHRALASFETATAPPLLARAGDDVLTASP
ncbi:MAG: L,D-transpeptidase family protein [Gammaproteobacteria bacterium]|nr:L,D-transpeptidase family protein [Gammaproteobacteria bacterium]